MSQESAPNNLEGANNEVAPGQNQEQIEKPPEKEVVLYQDIRSAVEAEGDPDLESLLRSVERAAVHYAEIANAHDHWWDTRAGRVTDPEEVERGERISGRRTIAHNVLSDSLNALSRRFGEDSIDNEWRNGIGLDRNQMGTWGRKVARYISDKKLKEHGLGKRS